MSIHCYSQRMLNPFHGIFCCIQFQSAEAITSDGIHWDIYVSNTALLEDMDSQLPIQTSDIRYGKWSLESGLRRGPMYPSDDFRRMEVMGDVVYEHLQERHDQAPFPFADNIELWLLGTDQKPLALLNSVTDINNIKPASDITWRPGQRCINTFKSNAISEGNAAEILAQHIQQQSGGKPQAAWFKRAAGGSGKKLSDKNHGNTFSSEDFPEMLIKNTAVNNYAELIDDFITWQSPWLLLLDGLDTATRTDLETRARTQALVVEEQFRLYPEIVDQGMIEAARVEAAMRKTQATHEPEKIDNRQATFYIEPDKKPFQ